MTFCKSFSDYFQISPKSYYILYVINFGYNDFGFICLKGSTPYCSLNTGLECMSEMGGKRVGFLRNVSVQKLAKGSKKAGFCQLPLINCDR